MPIIKWEPFFPFEDMERALGDILPDMPKRVQGFSPPMDIYRDGDNLMVEVELPEVDPEKVDVSIENDVLTIKGQSEKKREIDEKNFYRKEVKRGSFYRQVSLPAHVLGDRSVASYEDGLLKVVVPIAPEQRAKAIKIKVKSKK